MCIYIYIYICIHICMQLPTQPAAPRSARAAMARLHLRISTASFHNFKSQNFKLSVSNPRNKYVAYLSVLSRISNCQSLGRKNKLKTLKTYRISLSLYIYMYIHTHVYVYTYIYIYMYTLIHL